MLITWSGKRKLDDASCKVDVKRCYHVVGMFSKNIGGIRLAARVVDRASRSDPRPACLPRSRTGARLPRCLRRWPRPALSLLLNTRETRHRLRALRFPNFHLS